MAYRTTENVLIRDLLKFFTKIESIKITRRIILFILFVQVLCLFVPFYSNPNGEIFSTWNLLVKTGSPKYLAIFIVYLLSIFLLIPKIQILSRTSFICFFIGFILNIWIGWPFLDYIGLNPNSSYLILFGFYLFIFPPIALILYTPLILSNKTLLNIYKQYNK